MSFDTVWGCVPPHTQGFQGEIFNTPLLCGGDSLFPLFFSLAQASSTSARWPKAEKRVKGSDSRAKPAGFEGAVIVWDVLDTPPELPTDLAHHTMASRMPHILEFPETDRGKTVYIAVQWQSERGNTGPWSEILSAVIP
jgi:hypothetical protein